jgi:hypothetical protein
MSEPNDPNAETHVPKDDGNFLQVVIYAGIFLVLGLIAAFILIKGVGKHIVPGKHDPHPTSQVVLPSAGKSLTTMANSSEPPFIFTQQKIQTRV